MTMVFDNGLSHAEMKIKEQNKRIEELEAAIYHFLFEYDTAPMGDVEEMIDELRNVTRPKEESGEVK